MFKEVVLKLKSLKAALPSVIHKLAVGADMKTGVALCGRAPKSENEDSRWGAFSAVTHVGLKYCSRCARRAHLKTAGMAVAKEEWVK